MALIHCNFYSKALGLCTSMYVILPQPVKGQIGLKSGHVRKKHPTLYLLHGLSDDYSIWMRRTSIERYVSPLGLAVVMPEVHRGFYTDMARGLKYWTFISEELPRVARSFFPLSEKRKDNFAAGLSMGGYGAFKLALRKPESFAAAASLSGVLDLQHHIGEVKKRKDEKKWLFELGNIFGDINNLKKRNNDLLHAASRLKKSVGKAPLLYQIIGTEDFLYQDNLRFRRAAEKLKLNLKYEEYPGEHDWEFWDRHIQDVLKWLPINAR
jgi:putative tributyrin esterase